MLKKLMQLDLSENCVEHLPRELGEMTCLTDLLLSFNKIQQLPDGLGKPVLTFDVSIKSIQKAASEDLEMTQWCSSQQM